MGTKEERESQKPITTPFQPIGSSNQRFDSYLRYGFASHRVCMTFDSHRRFIKSFFLINISPLRSAPVFLSSCFFFSVEPQRSAVVPHSKSQQSLNQAVRVAHTWPRRSLDEMTTWIGLGLLVVYRPENAAARDAQTHRLKKVGGSFTAICRR